MKLFKTKDEETKELEERAKRAQKDLERMRRERSALEMLERAKREEERLQELKRKHRGSGDVFSWVQNLGDELGFGEEKKRRRR